MEEQILLPDEELFALHIKKSHESIFAVKRAIDVLEKEMESNKENRIVLVHVVDMLKSHIEFKKEFIAQGQKWLAEEIAKKESN